MEDKKLRHENVGVFYVEEMGKEAAWWIICNVNANESGEHRHSRSRRWQQQYRRC